MCAAKGAAQQVAVAQREAAPIPALRRRRKDFSSIPAAVPRGHQSRRRGDERRGPRVPGCAGCWWPPRQLRLRAEAFGRARLRIPCGDTGAARVGTPSEHAVPKPRPRLGLTLTHPTSHGGQRVGWHGSAQALRGLRAGARCSPALGACNKSMIHPGGAGGDG